MFKFQKYLKGGTCGIPYLHVFLLRKQFLSTKKYRTTEVFLAISTFPSSAFSQSSIDFKNFSEALWVFSDLCSWVTHIVARSKNSLKKIRPSQRSHRDLNSDRWIQSPKC